MKTKQLFTTSVLFCALVFSTYGQTADIQVIKESITQYDKGWDAKDVNSVLEYYDEDVDWTNAFGDRVQGKTELRTLLETIFSLDFVMSGENNYQEPEISFPQPNLALARSVNIRTGQKWPDGSPMKDRVINHLRVYQKIAGEWKIVHHMISQAHDKAGGSPEEINKEIARNFYQDLWFTNNTDKYVDYIAEEYVVHDIGDRKGVTEPAIEQKIIADRFWEGGSWDSKIDYQIAEGDLVATRWTANYKADSFIAKVMFGTGSIPIINVFRIEDGKIVEIWNHRHDIDTNVPLVFIGGTGLLIGLLIALIPTIIAFRLRKKLKKMNV
ncbi:MAG: nuclear transport factor 2 family protein [Bacteroidota bacterium]